jgi:hypothetical protein
MKAITLTQDQARGYFMANRKSVVIEFVLKGQEEPLEITGSRGRPISNGAAIKRLNQLEGAAGFTNRSVTDLGYQEFLFDGYNSRTKERTLGFLRHIPEGKETEVLLRITECSSREEAVIVSKFLCDTKLSKNRTIRRDIPFGKNTVKNLRMVGVAAQKSVYVEQGTTQNIGLKFA